MKVVNCRLFTNTMEPMIKRLQSVVLFLAKHIVISGLLAICVVQLQAQSLLLPGDATVVTVNASTNSFDLIPLVDIEEGTRIFVSNSVLQLTNDGLYARPDGIITFTSRIPAGTSVSLSDEINGGISWEGNLTFNPESDSLFLFQQDGEIQRFIFGLSWGSSGEKDSLNVLPEMLNTDLHTWVALGNGINHQYHLKHGASGTPQMLLAMVGDNRHWRSSDAPIFSIGTSFRLLQAPVVVFKNNVSSLDEGDSLRMDVAIYGHDGSRLTVDLAFQPTYSTADSSDVNGFSQTTVNFSGLIGDVVKSVTIPVSDEGEYEGNETAYFELKNLSKGHFGDFVNHVAFIHETVIPNVSISRIEYTGNSKTDFIEIENHEDVFLDVSGWQLNGRNFSIQLEDGIGIPAQGRYQIIAPSDNRDRKKEWMSARSGSIRLLNNEGVEIDSKTYRLKEIIAENKPREQDISTEEKQARVELESVAPSVSGTSSLGNSLEVTSPKMKVEEEALQITEGWFVMKTSEVNEDFSKELFFWNEPSTSFLKYGDVKFDSVVTSPMFYYKSASEIEQADVELESDSLFYGFDGVDEVSDLHELKFVISATDFDDNGIVNDAEGYNFLINTSSDTVRVAALMAELETVLGEGFFHPEILLWPEDGSGWSGVQILSGNNGIPPQGVFWLKADSLFPATEVVLQTEYLETALLSDEMEFDEPETHFSFSLIAGEVERKMNINWFREGETHPYSKLSPGLYNQLAVSGSDVPELGGYFENGWNSEINLDQSKDERLVIPLAISGVEAGELTLKVNEWIADTGWRVFLNQEGAEVLEEIDQNWNLNFEFNNQHTEISTSEERPEIYGEQPKVIDTGFQLIFYPPGVEVEILENPVGFELFQNYPNPFNPATTISFYLPELAEVKLQVFNVVGQPIATLEQGTLNAGEHQYEWNATGYPSGMYIYQLEVGTKIMTRKMTLVK